VSPDAFPLALLQEDALKTRANGVVKRHVGQTDRREGGRQKPCKLAARLHDRNGLRPLSGRRGLATCFRAIHQITKFLGELRMALPSGLSGDL
jgi:hypothetical protein